MAEDHSTTMGPKKQKAADENSNEKTDDHPSTATSEQQNATAQISSKEAEDHASTTTDEEQTQNHQAVHGTPLKILKKYPRRSGACDRAGTNFEIKMIALIYLRALRLLGSSFYIALNLGTAGSFDDVVLIFDKLGVRQQFCLQLKHSSNTITKSALGADATRGAKFSLKKHFQSVKDELIKDEFANVYFILFSNADICLDPSSLKIDDPIIITDFMHLLCTSGTLYNGRGDQVFGVNIDDTVFDHIRDQPNAKQFTDKLIIVRKQLQEVFLDELIKQDLIKMFYQLVPEIETLVKKYLELIEIYWSLKGNTPYLTETYKQWQNFQDNFSQKCDLPPAITFNDHVLAELAHKLVHSNSQIIHIKCSGMSMPLRSLKVFQALLKCKDPPECLYYTLDELEKDKKRVLDLWKDDYWEFLLVDLGSNKYPAMLNFDKFVLKGHKNKKVILLSDCNANSSSVINCLEFEETVSLRELDSSSQNMVLDQKFQLQGAEVKLRHLKLQNLLHGEVLSSLLPCKGLKIGDSLELIGDDYIPRKLCKQIVIKKDISELSGVSDIFYIVGEGNEEFVREVSMKRLKNSRENMQLDFNGSGVGNSLEQNPKFEAVTELQLKDVTQQFRNSPNIGDPVHILELKENEMLFWRESFGDPSHLFEYVNCLEGEVRDVEEFLRKCMVSRPEEDDLARAGLRNVIVTGEPGMGKSCLLISISRKLKQLHPDWWIIRIKNLSETMKYLKIESKSLGKKDNVVITRESIVKMLATEIKVEESNIEYRFLQEAVECVGNVCILCDGFDEISSNYSDLLLQTFKVIQEQTAVQSLWVTSRHVVVDKLENCLQTKAFSLEQFSETEIVSYLDETSGIEQAKKISQMIQRNTSDGTHPVSSIPLHLKMIRDLIISKRYFNTDKFNLYELYTNFTDLKLESYLDDVLEDSLDRDDCIEMFRERHKIYALIALDIVNELPELERENILKRFKRYKDNILRGREKAGFIDGLSADGQPRFAHRTFAEFFAGLWLTENKSKNWKSIRKITFDPQQNVLRAVLNQRLAKKCPVHLAVLDNDISSLRDRLVECEEVNSLDEGGRTPLHLACLGSGKTMTEMMKLLLNHNPKADVEVKDDLLNLTPLYYAVNSKAWDGVKLLLQHEAKVENNISDHRLVMQLKNIANDNDHHDDDSNFNLKFEVNWPIFKENRTLLHLAAKLGYINCIAMLLEKEADLEMKDLDGNTALHDAVSSGKTKAACLLMERGAWINAVNKQGSTPLHIALRRNKAISTTNQQMNTKVDQGDKIVEKLLKLGADTNVKNQDGDTPLHDGVRYGNRFLVKLLLDNSAQIEVENKFGNRPLHLVVSRWSTEHLQIIDLLLKCCANTAAVNKDGDTSLHLAIKKSNRKMVDKLLSHGVVTEIKNKLGDTPLHVAAREKNVLIVESLLKHGVLVNEQNKSGNTPLQVAIRYGNSDIVDLLLQYRSSLNMKNKNGESPLHEAVKERKSFGIVQKLLNHHASVNDETETGDTPLHLAAKHGNTETVSLLLKKGAKLDAVNKYGDTPLHVAIEFRNRCEKIDNNNKYQVVSDLCKYGAAVSISNNKGNTPLHIAVEKKIVRLVKLLLSHSASKIIKNKNEEIPLDIAKKLKLQEIETLLMM